MTPTRQQSLRPESREPRRSLGLMRIALVAASAAALAAFDFSHRGRVLALVLGVALPWALAVWFVGRRAPWRRLGALGAGVDVALLGLAQAAAAGTYAAVRFLALVLVATYAQVKGERHGVAVAALAIAVLVPVGVAVGAPVHGDVRALSEVVFACTAVAAGLVAGRLGATESTERARARELSRRAIEAENNVRRKVAQSIHDGPVQELVSLDMMLAAAKRSLARRDIARAQETIAEGRRVAERNIRALRDEIVSLGPYAFDEVSLGAALEQCIPVWSRRYGIDVELALEELDLPSEVSGALFGIAQEAIVNAGRHAEATTVRVSLNPAPQGAVELAVVDDGHGFVGAQPLAPRETGHIGLASMRERAELLAGTLSIESSGAGTNVTARIPLPAPAHRGLRGVRSSAPARGEAPAKAH